MGLSENKIVTSLVRESDIHDKPMSKGQKLSFKSSLRVEFQGSRVTPDGDLLFANARDGRKLLPFSRSKGNPVESSKLRE
jgi:hypothetical protein